jgi:hypothetical protein
MMLLALFLLLLQATTHQITFVIDDAHPASAQIAGYRWNVDGIRYSTKVKKPPPCVDCMERTYNLPAGLHSLTVTPYTAKGDLLVDAVTYDIVVDIEGGASEQNIYIGLFQKGQK